MKAADQVFVQTIEADWLRKQNITLDVLRLDQWHPVVSGNKWFKLRFYLAEAMRNQSKIATFGGAYSNHIVATAYACREQQINSLGIIRGEEPKNLSHTLQQAKAFGMELLFVSREEYKRKELIKQNLPGWYWIPEGGYGRLGAEGAKTIADEIPFFHTYTHLVCATGTGTTLAGFIKAALPHQTTIGILALKNNPGIANEISELLSAGEQTKNVTLVHDCSFGGYAKHTPELLRFMNEVWQQHHLPLDFVYTAKAFYGLQKMITGKEQIEPNSRILFVHTGGLQGNLSLPPNVLAF